MVRVAERSQLTADEYLAWERAQPVRHEFHRGEVFAMAGGSVRHNAISASVIESLRVQLRGRCVVLTSDQRVVAARRDRYVYPDVSVVCGPVVAEAGTDDVLSNPTMLVEVLSKSTEEYDRGLKWEGYQTIESLTDYLLVAQTGPRVEHYRRNQDGSWTYRVAGSGEHVTLTGGAALVVDTIYAGVFSLPGELTA